MTRARRVALALLVSACSRETAPAPLAASTASATRSETPRAASSNDAAPKVTAASAFALAAAPFGASLVWAEHRSKGVTLVTLDLNAEGLPERSAWELAVLAEGTRTVSDLWSAWQGMNRAALWLEHLDAEARVQALWKPETAAVAERFDLGSGYPASPDARGNIALAAGPNELMAFVRGGREDCLQPGSEPCYGFRFHRFGPSREPSTRITLTVPVPCEANAVALLLGDPRWYYGVCTTRAASTVFTLFTIQPNPEYASARELFADCVPRGALRLGDHPASIAECSGQGRVAWLGSGDDEPVVEALSRRGIDCDARTSLHVGSKTIELSEPLERLELVLPEQLVPDGARAAWTGRALVVANVDAGALALKRYGCRHGEWADLGAVGFEPLPRTAAPSSAASQSSPR